MAAIQAKSTCCVSETFIKIKRPERNGQSSRFNGFDLKWAPKFRSIRTKAEAASAPRRETDPKKRVVITGMGLVSVFGNDIDVFYNKLLEGESGINMIDTFDTSKFPIKIAGQIRDFTSTGYIDENIDQRLDDCWRYYLVAGKKALEDANLSQQVLESMDKTRIGVLTGSGLGAIKSFSNEVETLILKGNEKITPFFFPYSIANMGSALLAMDIGLMGPNYAISTGCAGATTCMYAAANHIKNGDADIMVAGGTEGGITHVGISGFLACGILSRRNNDPRKAFRPWDIDRDGTVLGEGSGVLIMESLEHAMKRGTKIYAEYLGGASNCDAFHVTDASPDGLALCITKCLEDGGISPEEVNYVTPHGTATRKRDIVEVNAIKKVFKDTSEMKMNATKSLIGHSLGASGAIEAITTIQAINTGWLHPTANQYNLDPVVTIDTVPNMKTRHEVNVAVSFNCGFGGHNAAIALAPFNP